jgi:hypothetical protein
MASLSTTMTTTTTTVDTNVYNNAYETVNKNCLQHRTPLQEQEAASRLTLPRNSVNEERARLQEQAQRDAANEEARLYRRAYDDAMEDYWVRGIRNPTRPSYLP